MVTVYVSYTELYCLRIKERPFLPSYLAFTPNPTQRPLDSGKHNCSGGPLSSSHFPSIKTAAAAATLSASRKTRTQNKVQKQKGKTGKTYCPTSPRPEVVFPYPRGVSGIFVAKASCLEGKVDWMNSLFLIHCLISSKQVVTTIKHIVVLSKISKLKALT